jgi:hypothetical protein
VASMSRRREPPFNGVANDRNEIAPPHRSSLRSRRHSNTSPNGSVLCVTTKLPGHGHGRDGRCEPPTGSQQAVTRLLFPQVGSEPGAPVYPVRILIRMHAHRSAVAFMNRPGVPLRTRIPRFRAKNFSTCARSPTARGSRRVCLTSRTKFAFSPATDLGPDFRSRQLA